MLELDKLSRQSHKQPKAKSTSFRTSRVFQTFFSVTKQHQVKAVTSIPVKASYISDCIVGIIYNQRKLITYNLRKLFLSNCMLFQMKNPKTNINSLAADQSIHIIKLSSFKLTEIKQSSKFGLQSEVLHGCLYLFFFFFLGGGGVACKCARACIL